MAAFLRLASAGCAILVLGLPAPAAAQPPNIDFNVSGTSTVRSWTCSSKGVIKVTPGQDPSKAVAGFANGVQTATVTVPVSAFTCPNEEMQQHLRDHLKADKFPEIVFRLDKYETAGGQTAATGSMTITGVTQPISFPLTLRATPKGVEVEGNTRLEFKTFNLDPPVVMLGMLKVGQQIRIEFKGLVAP